MTDPSGQSNPLQNLLGDLLKVIGGTPGGLPPWWEAARSLAHGVATDGAPEVNPDPLERLRLGELARVAELQVAEATGLQVSTDGQPVEFVPVGRGTLAIRTLEGWRPYLQAMVTAQESATKAENQVHPAGGGNTEIGEPSTGDAATLEGLGDVSGLDDLRGLGDLSGSGGAGGSGSSPLGFGLGGEGGLDDLLASFAVTMGPVLLGLQFGSTAGHLARRALGQYAVPVPWPASHELLMATQNIAAFAGDWSLSRDETELWACVRELTTNAVLRLPQVAGAIEMLVREATEEAVGFQHEIAQRLSDSGDLDALQSMMTDPEAMLADLMAPGARRSSDRLTAVMTALGGYVDHVTSSVTERMGSGPALSEAWYRYRIADAKGEQAAAALFGIDVGRAQVDRGAAFIKGVIDRAGADALAGLWASESSLPTPADVDAPGLWLERTSFS